jgi:cysteinyl-tRNA synthetase
MMWWFPPAFIVAAGLFSLAWTAFLLFEITKAVELVVEGAASLSSRQRVKNVSGAVHTRSVMRDQPDWSRSDSIRSHSRRKHLSVADSADFLL